jgi:GNAT superfamily N-acetyltransferase
LTIIVQTADPFSDAAQRCIRAYFEELQNLFDEGFDPAITVSADPAELVPPSGLFVIAYQGDECIGCCGLKVKGDGLGELKRMWVAPSARGLGVAQRLLETMEQHAVKMGVEVMQLDTNRKLVAARQLYLRNGYVSIKPYNSNPYAHHWFEKRLTGEV